MRIKVKIDGRKNVETDKGFPVVIYLTQNTKQKSKSTKEKLIRTGYFSKKEHWDKKNALPLSKHPDYVSLINYLEKKKIEIARLLEKDRLDPMPIIEAVKMLDKNTSDVFFEEAKTHITNRSSKNALYSFQKFFPDLTFNQITPETAKDYMARLMVTPIPNGSQRSSNGVLSYMNSLTALWNKTGYKDNPFSGVKPKKVKTKNKAMLDSDLIKIRDNKFRHHPNSKGGGKKNYLNYFMLAFYLGGVDFNDLAKLRYDKNVYNGRVEFYRSKGGTNVFVSNFIFPEAWEILKKYDCKPYLIPLRKMNDYNIYLANVSRDFEKMRNDLGISKKPYSKSPRYTFITRAQNLLIDERITVEIVGHSQTSTHSIYKDNFPEHIRDQAHKKIISLD